MALHSVAALPCGMQQPTRLDQAQQDIRAAQTLPNNSDRRNHGLTAQKHAQAVLLDPDSTPQQKSAARLCIRQARALAGELNLGTGTTRRTCTHDLGHTLDG